MSKLSKLHKKIVGENISNGDLLELFPGEDVDSLAYFSKLIQKKITAIGDDRHSGLSYVDFYPGRVPPYPKINKMFDTIFIQEAEWLQPEFSYPVDLSRFPQITMKFIDDHLKRGGKFVVSRVYEIVAKKVVYNWLNRIGDYDLLLYQDMVAVFVKK